jgi:hypothetical protein
VLADAVLTSRVAVFFADPPENLYQVRQWYHAFEALHASVGVTIIAQDSRSARAMRAETTVPVVVAARTRTVGALLADGEVRLVLYVGQANANAAAQRSTEVIHVFLNHGESDKAVSVSNQVKGFDLAFVGGQAGVDRHAAQLMQFDAAARTRIIGRPQVPSRTEISGPTTVLYAPTWEGTLAVNAYSTVKAYGEQLVSGLLADPALRVVYRPHPRTGASDRTYREADRRIRALISAHPGRARVDTSTDPIPALASAHVMIADVSAIATDWLIEGRPLITTVPPEPKARIASPARIFDRTPHIDAASAPQAAELVRAALADTTVSATLSELFTYYLGGMTAEQALAAFLDACHEAITLCERERARIEGTA